MALATVSGTCIGFDALAPSMMGVDARETPRRGTAATPREFDDRLRAKMNGEELRGGGVVGELTDSMEDTRGEPPRSLQNFGSLSQIDLVDGYLRSACSSPGSFDVLGFVDSSVKGTVDYNVFCACLASAEDAVKSNATPDWEGLRDTVKSFSGWFGVSPSGTGCAYKDSRWAAYYRLPGGRSASGLAGAGAQKPTKMVFDFLGGGACFSDETCASGEDEITFLDRMIFNTPTQIALLQCAPQALVDKLLGGLGILDYADTGLSNSTNPFSADGGYAHLFMSYCTGDVHAGGDAEPVVYKDTKTGEDVPIRHMGGVNTLKTLDWLKDAGLLRGLEEVVVIGESAGGVGANLWAWPIRQRIEAANGGTWNGSLLVFPDSFALRSRWSPNWDRRPWEQATSAALGISLGDMVLLDREGAGDDGVEFYDVEAQAETILASALNHYAKDHVLYMEVNGKNDTTQGKFLSITDDLAPVDPAGGSADADDIECRLLQSLHLRYCALKGTNKYASWVAETTLHGFVRYADRTTKDYGVDVTPFEFLASGILALRNGTGAPRSIWCKGCEPDCSTEKVNALKALDCAGESWAEYLAVNTTNKQKEKDSESAGSSYVRQRGLLRAVALTIGHLLSNLF